MLGRAMFPRAVRPVMGSRATALPAVLSVAAAGAAPPPHPRQFQSTTSNSNTSPTTPSTPSPASRIARKKALTTPHQRVLTIFQNEEAAAAVAAATKEHIPNTSIRILRTVAEVRAWTAEVCSPSSSSSSSSSTADQGVALIPTMGALHTGHTDLIREAAARGHDKIVVSIYVNPAQFGLSEDLDSYPATWHADCAEIARLYPELQAALPSSSSSSQSSKPLQMAVFAPTTPEMYPSGFPGQAPDSPGSFVTITPAGQVLEGKTRPTFFRGVATVCMKLFNIVQPSRVFFGQKDVQQTVIIRTMVRDFRLPLDVAVCPTTRDPKDGLALSSRNVYLGTRRRAVAPVLINALRAAEKTYLEHALDDESIPAGDIVPAALSVILDVLEQQSRLSPKEGVMFQLDYISLADPDTMQELEEVDPRRGAILSGAIKMLPVHAANEGEDLGHSGGPPVRLIDNLILPPRI